MNRFSDFNISINSLPFSGEKIKISKILNREVQVNAFKIDKSKYENKQLVIISIMHDGENRIIFSSSKTLMMQLESVPIESFPFLATIIKEGELYKLT